MNVFFFETFAFVVVFPICWWIGGIVAQQAERDPKPRRGRVAEVVDLAEWRRRRTDRPGPTDGTDRPTGPTGPTGPTSPTSPTRKPPPNRGHDPSYYISERPFC